MTTPNFLLQEANGILHGYWDANLLKIDLKLNSSIGCKLYRRLATAGKVQYIPTTLEQFYSLCDTKQSGWGYEW